MIRNRRTCAAVVRPTLTWLAGLDNPDCPTPIDTADWAFTDWGRLVTTAGLWFRQAGEGVLLVQDPRTPGTERERRKLGAKIVDSLGRAGWKTSESGIGTGWFFCEQQGRPIVMLGIGPWIEQGRTPLFDLEPDAPASVVASRLGAYHRLLGTCWRGTAGLTGNAMLRDMKAATRERTGGEPLWMWKKAPPEVCGSSFELYSGRHWLPAGDAPFVHRFDVRAMYLAAAGAAELAWSAPEWGGQREFTPDRPGYWRIDARKINDPLHLLTRDCDGLAWVTTPIVAYLIERGERPEIHDTVTADRQSRIMRGWAERLRDARQVAETHVSAFPIRPAIKDTYARSVGMMRRSTSRVYRPDWRDTIVDLAKVNLLRKVAAAGVEPLRYQTDSVWISSDDPHGRRIFPDEGGIGALRWEETMLVDEYRKKHEDEA